MEQEEKEHKEKYDHEHKQDRPAKKSSLKTYSRNLQPSLIENLKSRRCNYKRLACMLRQELTKAITRIIQFYRLGILEERLP